MTKALLKKYENLADLFYYPDKAFKKKVKVIQEFLDTAYPKAGRELQPFTEYTRDSLQDEIEEIYTRSFEVQAITAMDLGYLLFGDDYKRAKLLVSLNREILDAGIDAHNELADHLPNVLRLLHVLKDKQVVKDLIVEVIYPGLQKMMDDFNPDRILLKTKIYKKHHKTIIEKSEKYALIYASPIRTLMSVLEADYAALLTAGREAPVGHLEQTRDFLSSIATEMNIEDTPIK